MNKEKSPSYNISSVENACHILDCFLTIGNELSSVMIQKELGISANMAFRTLTTLQNCGYLHYNPETEKFRISLKILPLCNNVINSMQIRRIALPILQALHSSHPELNINMAVIEGGEVFSIHRFNGSGIAHFEFDPGTRLKAHATAVGKVLLAGLEDEEIDRLLEKNGMAAYTERSITDKGELMKEIQEIRHTKIAWCREEHIRHVNAVAAPIYDYTGKIAASVSIGSFDSVVDPDGLKSLIPELANTATSISYAAGYSAPPIG
ncbi:IclR family transcriptional regulator [Clostridium sp. AM58-1XD]|uniref:IclR family transcriptional regulator n=1 Tax=Clostridium sp. AM58-1XD TaxID=2292307 RepID=UPI000E514FA2|nr:IclR family transcriptional regulator [Clostridium sp. AM58-1XD]RGY98424.1 IclR family transcriptional regulator [Clostridium sp. AM58-1XD]